jgi:hypothetical protein
MRTHHFIAIAAIALVVLGVKVVAPATHADAYAVEGRTLDVLQLQRNYPNATALAELKMHDMTFALD